MQAARLLSIQVGQPREVKTRTGVVLTSIFKYPVSGKVVLRSFNLEGDRQADLKVHGGPNKAVYLYPHEHYSYWAEQLPDVEMPYGAFGENLTTEGLDEESAHIGDQFRIGSAILQVSQPRMPCFKLAIRWGRADMVKRFWKGRRPGIYFSVVKEGELEAGDAIEQVAAHPEQVSVADVVRIYTGETSDSDLYRRVLTTPLAGSWKEEIRERWTQMSIPI